MKLYKRFLFACTLAVALYLAFWLGALQRGSTCDAKYAVLIYLGMALYLSLAVPAVVLVVGRIIDGAFKMADRLREIEDRL